MLLFMFIYLYLQVGCHHWPGLPGGHAADLARVRGAAALPADHAPARVQEAGAGGGDRSIHSSVIRVLQSFTSIYCAKYTKFGEGGY